MSEAAAMTESAPEQTSSSDALSGNGAALPGTPPPASASAPWQGIDLSPESKSWVTGKAFKDVNAMVGSYQNLERDYRQSVHIPDEKTKPEKVEEFWQKLGKPAKAEDYTLENYTPPDGGIDLIPWFKGVAHQHNLPAKSFEGVAKAFVEHMKEIETQEQEAYTAQVQKQMDDVVKEWGPEAAKHQSNIQLFRKAFGLTVDQTTEMMLAIGPKAWAHFAARAGGYFAEAKIGGDLAGGGSTFGMSKEAAESKLSDLERDPAFAKRWIDQEPTAVNEVKRLRRIAAGES